MPPTRPADPPPTRPDGALTNALGTAAGPQPKVTAHSARGKPVAPDPFEAAPMSASLRTLARRGELRRLRKGVQLITEGDRADTLFIILQGRMRAFSADAEGREVTFGNYGPGEYLGEMGLDNGPRSANVETLEPTLCAVVARATLELHLRDDPAFAFELLTKVIRRARAATMGLKQIALNDVYGRLKALLDDLAQPGDDGQRVIERAPTHREMSQALGCSREMVSRVMKDLERGEYLRGVSRRVVLLRELPAKW
jgi:CRP/FNR family transcriptional regulator, cyclic AMP receptor protein